VFAPTECNNLLLRFAKKRKNEVFALQKYNLECSPLGEPGESLYSFLETQVKLKLDTLALPFPIRSFETDNEKS